MNISLIVKTVREYRALWFAALLALTGFLLLYMFATSSILNEQELATMLRMEWVKRLISALIGADVVEGFSPTGLASFGFSHPVMWAVLIAFITTLSSGVLAGEIDRGTMDLLGSLPISRASVYSSLSLVCILSGAPLCLAVWLGAFIGGRLTGANIDIPLLGIVAAHLYAAYVFLACFALMISAGSGRRGTTVLIVFSGIFYSFVLSVIAAFWVPAQKVAFLGFLHYYAPLLIVRADGWRWYDITVLLSTAVVCWVIGLVIFQRRDIPAR